MSYFVLDFIDIKSLQGLHQYLKEVFSLPDYYGNNMDALWDCLTDMVGEPIHIEIIGLEVIERQFGDYAGKLIETFRELKHYRDDKYSHEIQIEIVSGKSRVSLR